MKSFEGSENARARATAHRLDEDGVTVVIVHDQDIVVAGIGRDDEFPGLVRIDLPGGPIDAGCIAVI